MAEKQYLDLTGLQDVAGHVNTRLKTVTTIPASADDGAVRLYVGETGVTYKKGHIYQYNATDLEWVDITSSSEYTAGNGIDITDNEISVETYIFTGTQAQWDALTTEQKKEYDICNITDDMSESGGEGTTVIANPSGTATSELEKLQVDSVIYSVVTKAVNDLTNYYLKTETYTQTEVNNLIGAIATISFEVVATLPTTNIKTNVIYLVPSSDPQTSNVKDEYINLDGTTSGWELIGLTAIDLSGYVTTTDLNTALASYATLTDLGLKQDIIQVSTMPTASSDYVGKVYQYIGTTGVGIFTHGYFYECVEENSSYIWKELDVQASEIDDTITSINTTWSSNKISSEINGIDGSTVTPTDDIQTWLKCAELDEAYTTLSDVLADDDVMEKLFRSENASNYLARSTTWATDIVADQTAMILIGANDYCANKLLEDSTWLNAICNSTYFESILNVKVPTMTSNTEPYGEVSASSDDTTHKPYNVFDRLNKDNYQTATNWTSITQQTYTNQYIQYEFAEPIYLYKVFLDNHCRYQTSSQYWEDLHYDIEVSTNGSSFTKVKTGEVAYKNSNNYTNTSLINGAKCKYVRILCTAPNVTYNGYYNTIYGLQFYGRATKTTIYSAANDIVSFVDDEGAKVVTTDATGKGEVTIVCKPNTDITFTSSVAKDPNNLNENYSKVVTVKTNEPVYVMPNKDTIYWYGYKSSDITAYAYNYSGSTGLAPTLTLNTNSFKVKSNGKSDSQQGVAAFGKKYPLGNYSKVIVHCVSTSSYKNYLMCTEEVKNNFVASKYQQISKGINVVDISSLTTDQYVLIQTCNDRETTIDFIILGDTDDDSKAEISSIATNEPNATASRAYANGEHFYKDGKFCTAKTAIASGATFTLGTNYVEGTVADSVHDWFDITSQINLYSGYTAKKIVAYAKAIGNNVYMLHIEADIDSNGSPTRDDFMYINGYKFKIVDTTANSVIRYPLWARNSNGDSLIIGYGQNGASITSGVVFTAADFKYSTTQFTGITRLYLGADMLLEKL